MADTDYTELTDKIILGSSRYTAKDLERLGVGAVICVAPSDEVPEPSAFPGYFMRFPMAFTVPADFADQNAGAAARTLVYFVQEGMRVYIHCLEGNNRSAAVVVAAIAHMERKPVAEVSAWVASKRFIYPRAHWLEAAMNGLYSMTNGGQQMPLSQ